ncbi:MAG: hypothetical protein KA064_01425 [Firmicutes bacterium]|nr:hypothetical protein [Bacillota bacterium]
MPRWRATGVPEAGDRDAGYLAAGTDHSIDAVSGVPAGPLALVAAFAKTTLVLNLQG